jgi:endoglucanase
MTRRRRLAILFTLVPALLVTSGAVMRSRASTAAPPAFVRVDQLGYSAAGAKRAYLMSSVPESGAAFDVRPAAGGATVFSGSVGRSVGSWSKRFPYVYALDFDPVSVGGRFVFDAAGASSPPFSIGAPAMVFGGALSHALSFYENERDGPGFIRSALRTAPGHLHDGHAQTYLTPRVDQNGAFAGDLSSLGQSIDAAGGWWDAGDYLKFVQTTSYTVALMLAGVRDFPSQLGVSAVRSSNFTAEARFGVQWLLRMWNDRTRTLYYQVGIGDGNSRTVSDHDIWRLPQADDHYGGRNPLYRYIRHRPVFRAGPPGSLVSPNLAGRDAAAFALCFQVFRGSDRRLAARCLRAGEDIFAVADTHPRGHLLTAIPWDFYPETEWRDDLELGAVELADALADAGRRAHAVWYLRQAAHWARALVGEPGRTIDTLNLYDVSGLADFELYRTIGRFGRVRGLVLARPALVADVARQLHAASAIAARDPFGFGFPWDVEDTASHGFGLAVMASEYASMTGSAAWRDRSRRWLDNVLGANAWGTSLVIGDGTTFPDCPQHQVANLVGSLVGSGPVLAGAVVEGPSNAATTGLLSHARRCPAADGGDRFAVFNGHSAVFRDNVQSYSTVEPAIDLTASSPLAFAWQIASPRPLGAG